MECLPEQIDHTGKNDLTRRVTHREAVSGSVIHSIFDAWHYEVLWTCASTMIRVQLCALDTIHHAAFNKLETKLPNALLCTLPNAL
jgi:hypothetical protein